jgi:hypothetical protein
MANITILGVVDAGSSPVPLIFYGLLFCVAEWFKAPVLKTEVYFY